MSTLIKNKKAYYDYNILEEFEAGLVLSGAEVKAIKLGHLSIKGAFISIKGNTVLIKNIHVSKYKLAANKQKGYNPDQERELLLNKKEIRYLQGKMTERGLTIIPISVYTTRRLIKVKIALVKGKKKFDKRESIKKKDIKRNLAQKLKNY